MWEKSKYIKESRRSETWGNRSDVKDAPQETRMKDPVNRHSKS